MINIPELYPSLSAWSFNRQFSGCVIFDLRLPDVGKSSICAACLAAVNTPSVKTVDEEKKELVAEKQIPRKKVVGGFTLRESQT